MASALKNLQADISNMQAVLTAAGTNDTKRGAKFGIARATAQKIRDNNVSAMVLLLATQPELCAALLVDAIRNTAGTMPLDMLEAVEAQLTSAGKLLEDRHDVIAAPALEHAAQDFDDNYREAAAQLTDSIIA
jgi:hypothetical protein